MRTTQIGQSGQILHQILQLLPKIYPTFLRYRAAAHRPHQERDTFQLGRRARQSIRQAQGGVPICSSNQNAGYHQAVLCHD